MRDETISFRILSFLERERKEEKELDGYSIFLEAVRYISKVHSHYFYHYFGELSYQSVYETEAIIVIHAFSLISRSLIFCGSRIVIGLSN